MSAIYDQGTHNNHRTWLSATHYITYFSGVARLNFFEGKYFDF